MRNAKLKSFITILIAMRINGEIIRNAAIIAPMRISRLTITVTS
jgi:hypothetical protein